MPIVGRPEYDHHIPDGLGGDNSFENCRVLNKSCHARKTHKSGGDNAMMSKADRLREKHAGVRKTRQSMPGSKSSKWKKPFNKPAQKR